MKIVTRKSELKSLLETSFSSYRKNGLEIFIKAIASTILSAKIKFPLLEYSANEIFNLLPEAEQLQFCNGFEVYKTIGGNVLLRVILQL